MTERELAQEWHAVRRRSLHILPVALAIFAGVSGVTYVENLYASEFGFVAGLLVGITFYWVILEVATVLRVGKLLHTASPQVASPLREP